ncbi:PRC-barrel domain-containing protein [Actinoplanes sp. NPDC026623]|uniref:PRC-barrel domain-containing protein n=1 Tax=Actinoplanes sp. NPDC026623 TaxID=3155610 RepID=UPI0033F8C859
MAKRQPTLVRLGDTDQTLADPHLDIRGRTVRDREGGEIGKVDDLLVDALERKVRMLLVEHGGILGIGATPFFVPVEAVTRVTEDEVHVDRLGKEVVESPRYDPELVDQEPYLADVYGYYGYMPYWTSGQAAPMRHGQP